MELRLFQTSRFRVTDIQVWMTAWQLSAADPIALVIPGARAALQMMKFVETCGRKFLTVFSFKSLSVVANGDFTIFRFILICRLAVADRLA